MKYKDPPFFEVQTRPLPFFERPTWVPIFTNRKTSREDFRFYEKGKKQTQRSVFVSQQAITERVRMQQLEWRHQASSPGTALNISAARCLGFETVWVDLCFISIYFVHSLARCVLRYQKNLREVIFGVWECSKNFPYKLMVAASSLHAILIFTRKGLIGTLYFQIAGETCTFKF